METNPSSSITLLQVFSLVFFSRHLLIMYTLYLSHEQNPASFLCVVDFELIYLRVWFFIVLLFWEIRHRGIDCKVVLYNTERVR